jgi:uncharacterized lipoprotein YddW (UPF0748 family)
MLLPLLATLPQTAPPAPPLLREFRAAWVATVDNIDWPSRRDLGVPQQRRELTRILDHAKYLNLNALIFQIRPHGDALYPSTLEPWSEYLTNRQGVPPSPSWDPLGFLVREGHRRGLEIHCWINPYRARHPKMKGPNHATHIASRRPDLVRTYGQYQWMDPGEPEVQAQTLAVVKDVLKRYDLDGVHIDDYFYPYKEQGADGKLLDFPDDASYAKYRSSGGKLARDDWRRQNVNNFVKRLYDTIKKEKAHVKFGISPFGIYRPGMPEGIRAGVDQYADLYADARLWLREGWCDYYTPQLYWPIRQEAQAYGRLLDYWVGENRKDRHLWPGNYTSRTLPGNNAWTTQEVIDQIALTRARKVAGGNVHFSFKALQSAESGMGRDLRSGPYSVPAFVPATPWLGRAKPKAPRLSGSLDAAGNWRVRVQVDEPFFAFAWVYPASSGPNYAQWDTSGATELAVPVDSAPIGLAVRSLSRTGVESDAVLVWKNAKN